MVPSHLHPQAHKMHMSIGAFTSASARGRGQGEDGRGAKRKVAQRTLRLGAKGGEKRAYLSDAELAYWSENFALSDRETRGLERAVDRCFSRDEPIQSVRKLTGDVALPSTRGSFLGNNTSLNSSSVQSRYSLGLDQWVHWQTSPLPHHIIGHSRQTERLVSCLEFLDLLHTTDELGQSYELEMKSFLEREDVKTTVDGRGDRSFEYSEEQAIGGGGRRRALVKRKRILDSSDDEDFRSNDAGSKPMSTRLQANPTGQISGDEAEPKTVDVVDFNAPSPDGTCAEVSYESRVDADHLPPSPGLFVASKGDEVCSGRSLLATSHHVPRAPSTDSLDWIDLLEPSQVSTPKGCRQTTKLASSESSTTNRAILQTAGPEDFKFATPKRPPSTSKRSKSVASSATCAKVSPNQRELAASSAPPADSLPGPEPSPASTYSGLDLFVLEEFNDWQDCSRLQGDSLGKQEEENQSSKQQGPAREGDDAVDLGALELEDLMEDMLYPNVTVIQESDLEDPGVGGDEEGLKGDLYEKFVSPDRVIAAATSVRVEDEDGDGETVVPCDASDDSFIEVHGRRKAPRRIRGLLEESPARRPTSHTGSGSSGVSKENSSASGNGVKVATPRRAIDDKMETQWLGRRRRLKSRREKKNEPAVRFNFDSSDDEFQEPLLTRLRKKRKDTCPPASKAPRLDEPVSAASGLEGKCRPKRGDDRHVGFLEEEAELSDETRGAHRCSSDETDEEREYDFEDSFINDATMLTQVSPSQAHARSPHRKDVHRSPFNMADVYRRSLMSPDNLFAGKQRGGGNRYRMVLSQRHQLLNHYARRAGFRVNSGLKRPRRRCSSKLRKADSVGDAGLFESSATEDSSEAEEVMVKYGDEDLHELPSSQCSEGEEEGGKVTSEKAADSHRSGAVVRSDADVDGGPPQQRFTPAKSSIHHKRKRRLTCNSPPVALRERPLGIPGEAPPGSSCVGSSTREHQVCTQTSSSQVISASLLVRCMQPCWCRDVFASEYTCTCS